ncbi:MAG: glycosyltransferase [Candidatus Schekmanbacteria bacterium]|nr:glycosyltransferase [Candidatus Schekmanbacteria bacterium]
MKILIISPDIPHAKVHFAAGVMLYNTIAELSKRHEISLLSFIKRGEENLIRDIEQYCRNVYTVPFDRKLNLASRGTYFLNTAPSQVSYYSCREMKQQVAEITKNNKFDILQIEHCPMAQYADYASVPKKVMILHDILSDLSRNDSVMDGSFLGMSRKYISCKKAESYELKILEKFDRIITMSKKDTEVLSKKLPHKKFSVFPFWKELFVSRENITRGNGGYLLFNGNMERKDNIDAVKYFCNEIFPKILSKLPQTLFYVVGEHGTNKISGISPNSNVIIKSFVDDIDELYNACSVVVAPIMGGGGIKFKIINSLAAAKPVVTTSLGNEGIGGIPDKELMAADNPDDFAGKVTTLLKHPKLGKEIGENGYKLFLKLFNSKKEDIESVLYS